MNSVMFGAGLGLLRWRRHSDESLRGDALQKAITADMGRIRQDEVALRRTTDYLKTLRREELDRANQVADYLKSQLWAHYARLKDPAELRDGPIFRVVTERSRYTSDPVSLQEPHRFTFISPYMYDDPIAAYKKSLEKLPGFKWLPMAANTPQTRPFEVDLRQIPALKQIAKRMPVIQGVFQRYIAETACWGAPNDRAGESSLQY